MDINVPGTPKDEFIEEFGEDAFAQVPHTKIISWNHEVYVLDGWNTQSED